MRTVDHWWPWEPPFHTANQGSHRPSTTNTFDPHQPALPHSHTQCPNRTPSNSSIVDLQVFNVEDPDLRAPYGQGLIEMMAELELGAEELEMLRAELQTTAEKQLQRIFVDGELDVLLSINNRNAGLAALANYPALTIPMGYQEDGRPIGLTLIAPSFQEQELVDVGAVFERLSKARVLPEGFR